ncbi:hypothetical protein [Pedobacter sp. D749]|uniref:hypothetical protein n=1 Tax=Pedobacter sp. D749 TaxID=2856523 RepID=UPI001C55BA07|nr:hypothetical protein [Pedobacter sp. D749]QXU43138.1 hypothetical protein KYH19_05980 [Pedobacter sp. D749]
MKPLPCTFVTKQESNYREQWFNYYKYPILNTITSLQEGMQENNRLDFENIVSAIEFFKLLKENFKTKDDGVRVYFASPSSDGTVTRGKCGVLTLIFGITEGIDKVDNKNYFAYNGKTFDKVQEDQARIWVHNYQNVKRGILFETLSENDRLNVCPETKHIWFSLLHITQTLEEMETQVAKPGSKVTGFGIRFVSYTNLAYSFPKPVSDDEERKQRLTIAFTFMSGKKDIGIEDIDSDEFNERLEITINKFRGDTFDTGDPTPPPSSGNKAALDVSDQ